MPATHKAAIVGAAETDELGTLPHMSDLALKAQAAKNALNDAGLTLSAVDGFFCAPRGVTPGAIIEYLGIVPRFIDGTIVGGCSFLMHVRHAAAAIAAGYCDVALIVHSESGRSRVGAGDAVHHSSPQAQFDNPFGIFGAPTSFSQLAVRHMHEYGTTKEQMAHVAVATREWARLNPRAIMRERGSITPQDVMASRQIAYPFSLLDCCLVSDGGGALVVVSADRARDFPRPPVYMIGSGEGTSHVSPYQMRDMTTSDAHALAAREAFHEAGVAHADIQHAMLYDAFSFSPMLMLEDIGFVGRGESGPFVAQATNGPDGRTIYRTGPGGDFPMNTNGGGLSYCHTGMYGMFAILESVFQLRGEAGERQLPGLELSLVHGTGGAFASGATLILTNR